MNEDIKGSVTTMQSGNYNQFLVSILQQRLFESGSVLKDLIKEEYNLTDANARKVISRAAKANKIKSSYPFTFGNGQYIYLSPDKDLDADKIKSICKDKRPSIYRLLKVLEENSGILSYYEALKITASPLEPSSTKVTNLDDVINLLHKLNIIYLKTVENVKYYFFS